MLYGKIAVPLGRCGNTDTANTVDNRVEGVESRESREMCVASEREQVLIDPTQLGRHSFYVAPIGMTLRGGAT